MSDFMITNRGGGGISFAVIAVTYPAGSVCTCTNGTKTLRAKGTGGSFFFQIPSAGTWTVSCTDGIETDSQSVSITTQYQSEKVYLEFTFKVYKNGNEYTDTTGGWGANKEAYAVFNLTPTRMELGKTSVNSYYGAYFTNNPVDMTNYQTIVFKYYVTEYYRTLKFGVAGTHLTVATINNLETSVAVPNTVSTTIETISVDISSITGMKYPTITNLGTGAYIYEVYLI